MHMLIASPNFLCLGTRMLIPGIGISQLVHGTNHMELLILVDLLVTSLTAMSSVNTLVNLSSLGVNFYLSYELIFYFFTKFILYMTSKLNRLATVVLIFFWLI